MIPIPIDRITHSDMCAANLGRKCTCDREQLAKAHGATVVGLTIAVIVILALLARVLR